MELCLGTRSDSARRYLKYFMHHINLLRHYRITPVVVFDGGNIPSKSATELDRHGKREANLALAKRKLKEGDIVSAVEFFQKAVQVTPSMAHQLIQILRSENVEFIVAPYEADAQLAYLSTLDADEGGIEAVITEDSDLIAYGCQAIIFKMDRHGNGEEFLIDKVFNTTCDGLRFKEFDRELFVGMCVLSGCDFLPSISGIGTKRAYCLVNKYKNLERVLSTLKFDKRYQMPEDYADSFWRAIAVFHHARIYDAKSKSLKPLKPLEQKHIKALNGELDLLGPEVPGPIAAAIAEGRLNPVTMKAFNSFTEAETCAGVTSTDSWILITLADKEQPLELPACVPQPNKSLQNPEHEKRIFTDIKASIVNIQDGSYEEEKYMKEACALGRLVVPMKRHQSLTAEIVPTQVPDNNPFKKRKLEGCGLKAESCYKDAEKSSEIFSSLNSVGKVENEPEIVVSTENHKLSNIFKEKRDDKQVENNKRHCLFRFFQHL